MASSNDEQGNTNVPFTKKTVVPIVSTVLSLDDVLGRCGGFGRFQWIHYCFLNMLHISAGLVAFYYVFGAAEPQHRCRLPPSLWPNDNQYSPINATHESLLRLYIPTDNGKWDKCHLFDPTNLTKSLIDCPNGWIFDRRVYGFTYTEEANFVCRAKPKRSWLSTLVQTAGFSLLIVGALADKFGRKATITGVGLLLFSVCLCMQVAMQWIPMSTNSKFGLLLINQFAAGLTASISSIAFVLMLELTTSSHRSLVGIIALASFAFGAVLITIFAYVTRHWQKLLWAITTFIGLSLPYLFYMSESPLYLYSKKQYNQLETLLRRIAKTNGRADANWYPTFEELISIQSSHASNEKKLTLVQQLRQLVWHPVATRRILICCLLAFTGILLFFKISYGLATMNISPYIGILIGAAVEVIGYIIANLLMSTKPGRKYSLMIFTSLTCVCVFVIPLLTKRSTLGTVMISQLGKFAVSASIAVTWVYISELFPTSIRSSANGVTVAVSRLGAIAAPVIDSSIGEQYLPVTFYAYGGLALMVLLFILLLPETKDVPLGNIRDYSNDTQGLRSNAFFNQNFSG